MNTTLILLAIIVAVSSTNHTRNSSNWAVLIAGSNGYYNYRHQSDIAHAYQILTKMGGFPPNRVIVMMYNDVVNHQDNPFPGKLFNEPGGKDVYGDIKVSYSGDKVTAKNFLNVIQGITEGDTKNGPVLESGAEDHVFIYYADHGATGLVAMPTGEPLYAPDLNAALNYMYKNNMYKQLVFYLEACESGSMFDGILKPNISVFATTAATPYQSSWAFYCDNETLNTCMADEYSIRWMQDSVNNWNLERSLIKQFENVVQIVTKSKPCKYGDETFDQEPIKEFQAYELYEDGQSAVKNSNNNISAVSSRDVKLAILQNQYLAAEAKNDANAKVHFTQLVEAEIKYRLGIDLLFNQLVDYVYIAYTSSNDHDVLNDQFQDIEFDFADAMLNGHTPPTDFECLKFAYSQYETECERFTDYSLKYVSTLVNLCEFFQDQNLINYSLKKACNISNVSTEPKFEFKLVYVYIGGGIFALSLIVCFVFFMRRKKNKRNTSTTNNVKNSFLVSMNASIND